MFKRLLAALKTKYYLMHLMYSVITVVLLVIGIRWFLSTYTHNSDDFQIDLPNLVGLKTSQLEETLTPLELTYEITDTVFSEKGAKGTVLLQIPGPSRITKQKIKKGRTIYVTVISDKPKMIMVPKLVSKSRRHAEGVLKIIGLKANIKYKPYNDCNDCVIEQLYKGKALKEGARIPKGESITLVLGQKSGERVPVVDLSGLTIEQAQERLSNSSLTMFITCDCKTKKDSVSAKAYRQSPASGEVAAGTEISVWFSTDPTKSEAPK